jgi:chromosome condensin MukBEF complex kleisin-like MukF subunit
MNENDENPKNDLNSLVAHLPLSAKNELNEMASLLEEAAANLRDLMDTAEAEKLLVRIHIPDELYGCSLRLKEIAEGLKKKDELNVESVFSPK